jgi:hydroxymethylpyrimidine pyrophosphatase-like HAD family hydrolase
VVIFNRSRAMVLAQGISKATGLQAALRMLRLSPRNTVAVGDAENDHALLNECECGVAVANAVPSVQERADLVTQGDHGAGVIELIDRIRQISRAGRSICVTTSWLERSATRKLRWRPSDAWC